MNESMQLNREAAKQVIEAARSNPRSPYAGKFVGIVNGQVVVIADDWDDLARRLRQTEPDPNKTFALEVGKDYDTVQEIWNVH